jgi:hypothetical protein
MDLWNCEQPARLWIDVPEWIDQEITPSTIAAIVQGGCESGAYMPAVTYWDASQTMSEFGDEVLQTVVDSLGDLPKLPEDVSWSGIAVHFLSMAVDLWATSAEQELEFADENLPSDAELFLNDSRGIYLPRDFAESVRFELVTGINANDWDVLLAGPEHELYWDVWSDCLDDVVIDDGNRKFRLYQDGDLWLVPVRD